MVTAIEHAPGYMGGLKLVLNGYSFQPKGTMHICMVIQVQCDVGR